MTIVHPLKVVTVASLGAALALGLWALNDEWHIVRAADYMASAGTPSEPGSDSQDFLYRSRYPATAREALYLANANARLGAVETDPLKRRQYLDLADQLAEFATASRPKWANAWVTRSYVATLANPADPQAGLDAYTRSYADGPFLRDSGGWRVSFGVAHWTLLDAETKSRIVNEAAWLSVVSETANHDLSVMLVGTPLEVPFLLARAKLLKDVGRPDG